MPSSSGGRRCGSGGGYPGGLELGRRIAALFASKSTGPVNKNGAGGSSLRGAERRHEDFDHLSLENIAALRGGVSQSPSQYSLRNLPSTSSDHEIEGSSPASASTVDKQVVWQQNAKEHMRKYRPGKLSCRVHLKRFKELLETHGIKDRRTNDVRLLVEECVEDYGPDFDKVRWFEREKW